MGVELGKVIHWYDKINVAVVELSAPLSKGDKVVVKRGDEEFEDTITSIQIDHEDVDSAKKGDNAAVKFSKKAKEGSLVCAAE